MGQAFARAAAVAITFGVAASGCLDLSPVRPFDYLSGFYKDTTFPRLLIEIDYQEGMVPSSNALDLLKTRIGERLHKPGGVEMESKAFSSTRTSWSIDDMNQLMGERRDHKAAGDRMVLYVQYLDGRYAGQNSALGVQWGPDRFSVFKDAISTAANPANPLVPLPFTATDVERAVVVHEFGHVVGLVNHGVSMQRDREDPDHKGHSNNKNSVMYYAVESLFLGQVFNGPPPTQFDADDIADMRAAGGK